MAWEHLVSLFRDRNRQKLHITYCPNENEVEKKTRLINQNVMHKSSVEGCLRNQKEQTKGWWIIEDRLSLLGHF